MFKRIAAVIIRFRAVILIFTFLAIAASAAGIYFTFKESRANSDMLTYIGGGFETREGLDFLKKNFGIEGDAMFAVEGSEDDAGLKAAIEKVSSGEGVNGLIWTETLNGLKDKAAAFDPILRLLGLSSDDFIDTQKLEAFLKRPSDTPGKYYYIVLMTLNYPPSSKEAFEVLSDIEKALAPRPVAFAGMTETARSVTRDTVGELPIFIITGVAAIFIILMLTSSSYVEPLIIIVSLGVALIINMGSNYLFPGVSVVGYAASAILQLCCTLDYAVIFLHFYRKKRALYPPLEAAAETAPQGFSWLLTSAAVTSAGLVALCAVRIGLGKDLAFVLIKGVICSLITVIALTPCLLFMADKLILNTSHKPFIRLNYTKYANFIVNKRAFVIAVSAILLIAALAAQAGVQKSYFKLYNRKEERNGLQAASESLANQVIIAVPLIPKDGKTHKEFIRDIEALGRVDAALGVFSAVKFEAPAVEFLLENTSLIDGSGAEVFFAEVEENGKTVRYTMYTLMLNGAAEDGNPVELYEDISKILDDYFDSSYKFGVLTAVYDMAGVSGQDYWTVTLLSALTVFLLMLILLKSVRKSLIITVLIELGVWLNLALTVIFGASLNFLIYMIIGAVQTGCTVNYALFVSVKYNEAYERLRDGAAAAKQAVIGSGPAVLTGMSLLAASVLSIYFSSENLIVKDISLLLARGGIIGALMSLTAVPCLLAYYKEARYPAFIKRILKK